MPFTYKSRFLRIPWSANILNSYTYADIEPIEERGERVKSMEFLSGKVRNSIKGISFSHQHTTICSSQ